MSSDSTNSQFIKPGSTIGILGGGQLGKMMAIAAKHMGYRVHIFSQVNDSPAAQVADYETLAEFNDLAAIDVFAQQVDVVTVETENIPVPTLEAASKHAPAFPGERTLQVCQNRGLEKQFLVDNGIPTVNFRVVRSLEELQQACQELMPSVLKTTTGGYDGKGQAVIRTPEDIESAWSALNAPEAILEEWIEYDFEFSIVATRNSSGEVAAYPSIRNEHENGILDVSISPSGLADEFNEQAANIAMKIMLELNSVGVLTVEFFFSQGKVLVNEIAPRPHNSGHLTIEGHVTNQFEQHVRAVCGLKCGSTEQLKPVAMANLLGDQWSGGEPYWDRAIAYGDTKLHLYGKEVPKPGRKMGHLTSFGQSGDAAKDQVITARGLLTAGREAIAGQQENVST